LSSKKPVAEMGADALREAGTLIIVFAPLYELFEPVRPKWGIVVGILVVGFSFLWTGIEVERRRA
jgi:hypothetical protein